MAPSTPPIAQHRLFVEQFGLLAEESGMPRMAGRVLGELLLAEAPELCFGDLVDGLQASKGAISTTTRLLIQRGLIERVSIAGDRRDFFRLCDDAWVRLLQQRVEAIGKLRNLAERGLPMLEREPATRRARLREMHEFYTWWEREAAVMLRRWAESRPPRERL